MYIYIYISAVSCRMVLEENELFYHLNKSISVCVDNC